MLVNNIRVVCLAGILLTALSALNAQPMNSTMTVPRTVRYAGSFRPADGLPTQSMEGVTIAVYRDQTEGDPLWRETQNVQVDASGNFVVEMGATLNEGLPLDLLRSGEPRWVGARVNRPGEAEQPRVQMLSVPYALRASDPETLGGLPASAFLVNPSAPGAAATTIGPASSNAVKPHATSGTSNYIGLFANATDLSNSALYQNAGKIGLNTTNPLDYVHVAFNDATGNFTGYSVQNLGGGTVSYSGMLFYDQNSALVNFQGFNNSTHEYRINNIASNGSINFMLGSQSKFQVRNDGDINIAGSIRKGGALFLHNLGINDTALGMNALAVSTGADNTAVGIQALTSNTAGNGNTATGSLALQNNTTGNFNSAAGAGALQSNTMGTLNTANGFDTLVFNTTGTSNTADGANAMYSNTLGSNNTASGFQALYLNTTGSNNTAIGQAALASNTASGNTAVGQAALQFNSTGAENTAIGISALKNNTTGYLNSALGYQALLANTTGFSNTATGSLALQANTSGANNTASGIGALASNTAGYGNTASGANALESNTSGDDNTASGINALAHNITGNYNTAIGGGALASTTTGSNNTASGEGALVNNTTGANNTAMGTQALQLSINGSNNSALGYLAGYDLTTGGNNIMIGNTGTSFDDHKIRIGDVQTSAFIAGIRGINTGASDAVNVVIDSNGQLGTINSSRRFKEGIQDMGNASNNLLRLRPVTYRYKQPYADGTKPLDYGLIAEEVAEVYPDLVVKNKDGEIETVQYQKLTPMLLNELQKQAELIRKLEARLATLESAKTLSEQ